MCAIALIVGLLGAATSAIAIGYARHDQRNRRRT